MVTIFSTLKKSFPYLLNSASGILIYGGFIGIFSFYLDSYHIAILSIYHTVILSLGYQGYDVIFRNYQLRINEPKVFKRLCLFLLLSGTFVFSLLTLIGVPTLELFYSSYNFIEAELILFCCFSFLEFGYLLATTRLQMSVSGASVLYRAAITKICLFLVTASCAFYVADLTIVKLLCCLILFSVVNILNLIRMQRSITPEFRSNGLYEKNSNQSN